MFCCRISVFNCPSYLFITGTEVTPVKSWSTSSLSALHTLLSRTQQTDFWRPPLGLDRFIRWSFALMITVLSRDAVSLSLLPRSLSVLLCTFSLSLWMNVENSGHTLIWLSHLVDRLSTVWEEPIADGTQHQLWLLSISSYSLTKVFEPSLYSRSMGEIYSELSIRGMITGRALFCQSISTLWKMWEEPWRQYGSNCPPGS